MWVCECVFLAVSTHSLNSLNKWLKMSVKKLHLCTICDSKEGRCVLGSVRGRWKKSVCVCALAFMYLWSEANVLKVTYSPDKKSPPKWENVVTSYFFKGFCKSYDSGLQSGWELHLHFSRLVMIYAFRVSQRGTATKESIPWWLILFVWIRFW